MKKFFMLIASVIMAMNVFAVEFYDEIGYNINLALAEEKTLFSYEGIDKDFTFILDNNWGANVSIKSSMAFYEDSSDIDRSLFSLSFNFGPAYKVIFSDVFSYIVSPGINVALISNVNQAVVPGISLNNKLIITPFKSKWIYFNLTGNIVYDFYPEEYKVTNGMINNALFFNASAGIGFKIDTKRFKKN